MYILELFSGTASVSKVLKELYENCEIVSVDILPGFNPTHAVDILTWEYTVYPPKHFEIIWASPPCTEYSKAKRRSPRNLALADSIVERTLQIIDYFKATYWYIENPADGGLMKHRPVMQHMNKYIHTCCYCRYGFEYRKATNIWTNRHGLNLKMCYKHSTPCDAMKTYGKHMKSAQYSRSSCARHGLGRGRAENAYSIPRELIISLVPK